jgi:hypothetical protein
MYRNGWKYLSIEAFSASISSIEDSSVAKYFQVTIPA